MSEAIKKAVEALKAVDDWMHEARHFLPRDIAAKVEASIAALTALQEQPAHVGVKRWHEEITGMVPGSALYEGQQEYVRYEDYLSALQPSPAADPLTAAQLSEALGAFWNAAIGEAHDRQGGMDAAVVMAVGLSAVAARLSEFAKEQKETKDDTDIP
jgi:hypothetical protein